MLSGFALAVTLRMRVLNLGAEGQIYIGAVATAWLALSLPGLPAGFLLPAMFVFAFRRRLVCGRCYRCCRAYCGARAS